jgi:hypothetical protein
LGTRIAGVLRTVRSKRELHQRLSQRRPLIGGFFDDFAGGFAGAVAGAGFDPDQDPSDELFSAFFLFARSVFDGTTLSLGHGIVIFLLVHSKLGLHSGFFVKHLPDRGRFIPTMFLIGERLEGSVEGERKSDRNGR